MADAFFVFFAKDSPFLFGLLFLGLWFLLPSDRVRRAIFYAVLGGVLALGINWVIGHLYYRPRPFVALRMVHRLISHAPDSSFPSDHVAGSFAFAVGMNRAGRGFGLLFYSLAVIVALARVFVGVHWPSDVLGGAVIGLLAGWFVHRFRDRLDVLADRLIALFGPRRGP